VWVGMIALLGVAAETASMMVVYLDEGFTRAHEAGRLRTTADLQSKVGKGEVELPAREMLAEILLLDGRAADALKEYELSLASDPNRFNALLGAARAAEKLGRKAVATKYYKQLPVSSPHASGAAP